MRRWTCFSLWARGHNGRNTLWKEDSSCRHDLISQLVVLVYNYILCRNSDIEYTLWQREFSYLQAVIIEVIPWIYSHPQKKKKKKTEEKKKREKKKRKKMFFSCIRTFGFLSPLTSAVVWKHVLLASMAQPYLKTEAVVKLYGYINNVHICFPYSSGWHLNKSHAYYFHV